MWSKRDWVIFFAGAQAFHMVSHIILNVSGSLPLTFFSIVWTPQLNVFAIIFNGLTTIALLWWASRLK